MSLRALGWPTCLCLFSALASLAVFLVTDEIGLMMSYPIQIFGLIMMGIAIYQKRNWWLFIVLPILALPLAGWLILLAACSQGNCI